MTSEANNRDRNPCPELIAERYRIVASLGEGGAAHVFRAVDEGTSTEVALKLLKKEAGDRLRAHFEVEYRTLADLHHPHTVTVYEFGHDPHGAFYTMEVLTGSDLSKDVPLPWPQACQHVGEVCGVLALLHARGLVHRDVSPRNLWRTEDDVVKLIDFGALSSFGPQEQVIGTPAFLAPEALAGAPLDARSDLYSLGAVAYFLLTGQSAYPARSFSQLRSMWRTAPPPPSAVLNARGDSDLPAIPAELDSLVLSLLHQNVAARPQNGAEVLDRISSLLGAGNGSKGTEATLRISNARFVGREAALRRIGRQLALALRGRRQLCIIEGAAGVGRSRLLSEAEQRARVQQATVLRVQVEADSSAYAVTTHLGEALLRALPGSAQEIAAPYLEDLALSSRLRSQLTVDPGALPPAGPEQHVRLRHAFRRWFTDVAVRTPLILLVDGLEHADEESLGVFLAMAHADRQGRWLLVGTRLSRAGRKPSKMARGLARIALTIKLDPLSEPEHVELLTSIFGPVPYLPRLSAQLFKISGGNVSHSLELCRELLARGSISFVDGTWVLPSEIGDVPLATTREQALTNRLRQLTPSALALAQAMCVQSGPIPEAWTAQLAPPHLRNPALVVDELLRCGVLLRQGRDLLFAHESLRRVCMLEAPSALLQRARVVIAECIMRSPLSGDILARLQAGLHFCEAGDERGPALVVSSTVRCAIDDGDALVSVTPLVETALTWFRERGRSKEEQLVLLAALTRAGHDVSPRLHWTYADETIAGLAEMLCLPLARRLQPVIGGKLGLAIAMGKAGAQLLAARRRGAAPSLLEALAMINVAVVTSTAARGSFGDPDGAERIAEVLRPFAALGPRHIAAVSYEYCWAIAQTVRDNHPATCQRWLALAERLEQPVAGGSPDMQQIMRIGALLGAATLQAQRDDDAALRVADELDRAENARSATYAASVRASHYGFHGQLELHEQALARLEELAIENGTSWQSDIWWPGPTAVLGVRLHDAMMLKRAAEQNRQLGKTGPMLRKQASFMYGAYLQMRGRYVESLPWLAESLEMPLGSHIASGLWRGVLARSYNRLGEHPRAHQICVQAMHHYQDAELDFPAGKLILWTELAIAQAMGGECNVAEGTLTSLEERYGPHDNPLTLGAIAEARVEIALLSRDGLAAERHLQRMVAFYGRVECSSLTQRCGVLEAAVRSIEDGPADTRELPKSIADDNLSVQISLLADLLQTRSQETWAQRVQNTLRVLATGVGAGRVALYSAQVHAAPRVLGTLLGYEESQPLQKWVRERIKEELSELETATLIEDTESPESTPYMLQEAGWYYSLAMVPPRAVASDQPLLFLVFGKRDAESAIPHKLLALVTQYLDDPPDTWS